MKDILRFMLAAVLIAGVVVCEFALDAVEAIRRRTRKPGVTTGRASYYGEAYRGRTMANGQPFDPDGMTCACWRWPLGQRLRVEHQGREVIVLVTDRGPAVALDRLIDLSQAAFDRLAPLRRGVIAVNVRVEP